MLVKNAFKNQTWTTHCRYLCSNPLSSYGCISCVFSNSIKLAQVHVSTSGGLHRPQKLTFFLHLFYRLRHPTPTTTASFPHNPSLWLLFRVGPGDRRKLTECMRVCVSVCSQLCTVEAEPTFYHSDSYMALDGWLAKVREALWFRPLCKEREESLVSDYTPQPKSRSDINLTFSSITHYSFLILIRIMNLPFWLFKEKEKKKIQKCIFLWAIL